MAIFFLLIGFILIDSGARGNAKQLFEQVDSDAKGFVTFGMVVIILSIAGISNTIRPISKSFLILIFVVYFVKNSKSIINNIEQTASTQTNTPSAGAQQAQAESAQAANAATAASNAGSQNIASVGLGPNDMIQSGEHELQDAATTLSQGYATTTVPINPAGTGRAETRQNDQFVLGTIGTIASFF